MCWMKWHRQRGKGGSWGWLWKWTSSGIFLSKQVASIVIYHMKWVPSTLYLVAEGMWLWARLILEILWMKNLSYMLCQCRHGPYYWLGVASQDPDSWSQSQRGWSMLPESCPQKQELRHRYIPHIVLITPICLCILTSLGFWDTKRLGFSSNSPTTLPSLLSYFFLLFRPLNVECPWARSLIPSLLTPLYQSLGAE